MVNHLEWCISLFYLPLSDKLNFVYRDQIALILAARTECMACK